MQITPKITQVQGMILVQLQASFVGGPTDAEDKANIQAFGDPMVNLTGGLFVDNNTYPSQPATVVVQGITFTTSVQGPAANQVSINFISAGQPDASAISVAGNAITVDIYDTTTSMTRTTASVVALFANYASSTVTTNGGTTLATGGSGVAAAVTADPISFAGGAASYTQAFEFNFPASDLYVGVTTQMQGYTARFMTQLPPAPRGIPEEHWEHDHRSHHGYRTHGSLDCVTSSPQQAATFWIATIESRITTLFAILRAKSPLGPQSPYTV
jgi:hypothetical protein